MILFILPYALLDLMSVHMLCRVNDACIKNLQNKSSDLLANITGGANIYIKCCYCRGRRNIEISSKLAIR